MTNLITQLADYSLLRHRSRTPRLLVIIVATLRHGSRTPGLLVIDAATLRHGSRTPRLLGTTVATWIVIRRCLESRAVTTTARWRWLRWQSCGRRRCRRKKTTTSGEAEDEEDWPAAGASATATTGDRLAATEVADGEEQQLLW
ncbi:hypothetical protein BHE74_00054285 [Ensete ventricosum]|nr:hypothetical protein BHE74_00054285 [Ensete ventricosum]